MRRKENCMKKVIATLSVFAIMVAMVASAAAQVGNGGDFDRGKDGSGQRLWKYEADGIVVSFGVTDTLFVGQFAQIEVTVTNKSGRALPDITAWWGEVVIGTQAMANAKEIKNGDVDKVISKNDPIIFGYDSKGKPYYSNTLPDGASFTFYLDVDTSVAGEFVYEFEVWSRLDNKNWRELLLAAAIDIEVIPQLPGFPIDISPDKDGNLIINRLGIVPSGTPFDNASASPITITLDGVVLNGSGQGSGKGSDYQNSRDSIKIFASALGEGVFEIVIVPHKQGNGNNANNTRGAGYLAFELIFDANGKLVGATLLDCHGCLKDYEDCVCDCE